MEIKNTTFFLFGIIMLILGMFVVTFDYPQILYFDQMSSETYALLDLEEKGIHQRLLIEISIGVVIVFSGVALVVLSFVKKLLLGNS